MFLFNQDFSLKSFHFARDAPISVAPVSVSDQEVNVLCSHDHTWPVLTGEYLRS